MKFIKLTKDEQRALDIGGFWGCDAIAQNVLRGPRYRALLVIWPGQRAWAVRVLARYAREEREGAEIDKGNGDHARAKRAERRARLVERLVEKVRAL